MDGDAANAEAPDNDDELDEVTKMSVLQLLLLIYERHYYLYRHQEYFCLNSRSSKNISSISWQRGILSKCERSFNNGLILTSTLSISR